MARLRRLARRLTKRLHARLAGARLSRSVERYQRAADELDAAVREILQR